MNDHLTALEQDIGFLKSLAVEGRPATLIGGSILVAAGLTFGAASLGQWAGLSGLIPSFGGWTFPGIWAASMVAFFVELFVILRRLGPKKSGDTANRAVGVAWSAAGWTIFCMFVCAAIIAWRTHSDATMMLMPSIVLSLYGLSWAVAASMSGKGWVWACVLGAYAAAVIVAVFSSQTSVYLVFAAALMLLAVVPGLALVRQARAAR